MVQKVFLIGYRGVGKSSVGHALSRVLGWDFWDLDERIVAEQGVSIKEIVKGRGWRYFRERERDALAEAADQARNLVVACGGGAVMHDAVWPLIKENAVVVWLKAGIETILRRLEADPATEASRPALAAGWSLEDEIKETLCTRTPLYRRWADISIDTDGRSPDEIAREIMNKIIRV
ncbi:MAG: shikimate kinase [Dissulfurimicrobium sp.]|uniref:shikimate kinase n=1 Tax=Dissulfurimicrobium TaxID=1769732 RepID=UPI001EDBC16E|nr:shikimate kinase [Dissulfurimicrobium hydrothermale]UKL14178.1 shikimate kinase [Dissulfurimicrobium hydrothermale]